MHVQEDHFLCEILDPETHEPLPDGERGELVLTTLTRDAMPVLRYRTGDLTSMTREPCACGRTTARIAWLTGRVDDMLVVRGVNVFPTAVEHALLGFAELAPHYRMTITRPDGGLDDLHVECELRPDAVVADAEALPRRIAEKLFDTLLVTVRTTVLPPAAIERIDVGKAKRVYDLRAVTKELQR
jgi:phenylacetate-CoA ligase